jgi:hypothetical protein
MKEAMAPVNVSATPPSLIGTSTLGPIHDFSPVIYSFSSSEFELQKDF